MITTGISIHRLADGKIEETWDNYDALGMLQLGVIPSPERPEEVAHLDQEAKRERYC